MALSLSTISDGQVGYGEAKIMTAAELTSSIRYYERINRAKKNDKNLTIAELWEGL